MAGGSGAGAVEHALEALGAVRASEVAGAGAGVRREVPVLLPQLPRYLPKRSLCTSKQEQINNNNNVEREQR